MYKSDSEDESQALETSVASNSSNNFALGEAGSKNVKKYASRARRRDSSDDESLQQQEDTKTTEDLSAHEHSSSPEDDDLGDARPSFAGFSNYSLKRKHPQDDDDGGGDAPIPAKSVAEKLMAKMGHIEGRGLGKEGQGMAAPIKLSTQRGRMGLGHQDSKALQYDPSLQWDDTEEKKTVEETPNWLELFKEEEEITDEDAFARRQEEVNRVLRVGNDFTVAPKKLTIDDEDDVVEKALLKKLLEAKTVFDTLNDRDLRNSRTRANPYETIGSGIFQNRAAMKSANMDGIFNFMFSRENLEHLEQKCPLDVNEQGTNALHRYDDLFYFADVCAGPGGFSEYELWRKNFYNAKGFGFTLKGKDDFKLTKFLASSPLFFEPYYGVHDDGDVTKPENIDSFEKVVMKGTDGQGVHLMMADGGFSVEGQENIQEILSKRIYLCQLLVSLCVVREGGNFYCKLFDVFTRFSYELVFLMSLCYKDVCIHKPHTSRPANSERYIICKGLMRKFSDPIRDFLKNVNKKMEKLSSAKSDNDVQQILPNHFGNELTTAENDYITYIIDSNNLIAKRQIHYLEKYRAFATNVNLLDMDQAELREKCMKYWRVPYDMQPKQTRRTGINQEQRMLIPADCFAKFAPTNKLIGTKELSGNSSKFETLWKKIFYDEAKPGQLVHEEYRCFWATEFKANQGRPVRPTVLVATPDAVFTFDNGHWNESDRFVYRVPGISVLLVEFTSEMRKDGSKVAYPDTRNPTIIRIFDAAALAGDNISELSYDNRILCIEKFCKAANLVENVVHVAVPSTKPNNHQQGRYRGPVRETFERRDFVPLKLVPVKTFMLDKLVDHLPQELTVHNENIGVIEENERCFKITGIYFFKFLADGWTMNYSRSTSRNYAYNQTTRAAVYSDRFEAQKCVTNFWNTALYDEKHPHHRLFWSWRETHGDSSYGPKWIMNEETSKMGPTMNEINKRMYELKKNLPG